MNIFGRPSGAEPRITYERIDLSAEPATAPGDTLPPRGPERLDARHEPRIEPRSERPRAPVANPVSGIMLVAADSELEGRLRSRGAVRVEGVLRGGLQAPVLFIEPGGLVEGSVTVERARICGTLRGSLVAREIEVVRTATLDAELLYDEISIERGARVRGLHRQRDPEPAESAPMPGPAMPMMPAASLAEVSVITAISTAALVAEAEAALQSLAQVTQAAAEAVDELSAEGVTDLVALEVELRGAPEEMLIGKPAA
ncbi:polymer-forming cytoskeletal protein [Roseomonas sp. 18066]|uniref:bactofilin family protein n=1 Tax=Roseomonas sp. 18066 TaxID=2681412 RepID=UPI00135CE679|nr:polymer-forming cytoskeletal protein [Roseomonas sp. 18066]